LVVSNDTSFLSIASLKRLIIGDWLSAQDVEIQQVAATTASLEDRVVGEIFPPTDDLGVNLSMAQEIKDTVDSFASSSRKETRVGWSVGNISKIACTWGMSLIVARRRIWL
jgi:hypothetical protein